MVIFPGIVLVKDLHEGYHEDSATLKVVRPGVVAATINDGDPVEYRIRPFVYW